MKKIIFHIGSSKTGSSIIQKLLLDNHKNLVQQGIYYPKHKVDGNEISGGNASRVVELLNENQNELAIIELERFISESTVDTILLSSESLFLKANELREITKKLNIKIQIIACCRSQVGRIESSYNQSVKKHKMTSSPSAFLKRILSAKEKNFSNLIVEEWASLFGKENLIVIGYSRNVVPDFFLSIGVKLVDYKDKSINVSYSSKCLQYKVLINKIIVEYDLRSDRLMDRALQKFSQIEFDEGNYVKTNIFTETEKLEIKKHFLKANKNLINNYNVLESTLLENDFVTAENDLLTKVDIIAITRDISNIEHEIVGYLVDNILLSFRSENKATRDAAATISPALSCARQYHYIQHKVCD